jgi:hypothetical protein
VKEAINMNRCILLVSGLLLLSLLVSLLPGPAASIHEAKRSPPSKLARARFKAAKEAHSRVVHPYVPGADQEKILESDYPWSKQLLEAERDVASDNKQEIAAFKAHLERMTKLDVFIQGEVWRSSQNGKRPYERYQLRRLAIAAFYRAEAELWLERAKAKT